MGGRVDRRAAGRGGVDERGGVRLLVPLDVLQDAVQFAMHRTVGVWVVVVRHGGWVPRGWRRQR